jgi:hypothetical protein
MARHARIIHQATDYQGSLWDVWDTPYSWKVLLGWPAGVPNYYYLIFYFWSRY